jgi:hypothetical protein
MKITDHKISTYCTKFSINHKDCYYEKFYNELTIIITI